jgi:hypothetical protein
LLQQRGNFIGIVNGDRGLRQRGSREEYRKRSQAGTPFCEKEDPLSHGEIHRVVFRRKLSCASQRGISVGKIIRRADRGTGPVPRSDEGYIKCRALSKKTQRIFTVAAAKPDIIGRRKSRGNDRRRLFREGGVGRVCRSGKMRGVVRQRLGSAKQIGFAQPGRAILIIHYTNNNVPHTNRHSTGDFQPSSGS